MNLDFININHRFSDVVYESHLHENYEFYFILSDNITVETEKGVYYAGKGDFFVFAPFSFHKITSDGKTFERCIMFVDEAILLENAGFLTSDFKFFRKEKYAHFKIDSHNSEKLISLFDRAQFLVKNKCEGIEDKYDLIEILCGIFKIIRCCKPQQNTAVYSEKSHIAQIMGYVKENAEYGIKLSDVSKKFGIGQTKLHALFKESLGVSPGEYILRIKILRAISLLENGASVTEAANLSGFNSYSHFIRIFKSRTGISPYKYKYIK